MGVEWIELLIIGYQNRDVINADTLGYYLDRWMVVVLLTEK